MNSIEIIWLDLCTLLKGPFRKRLFRISYSHMRLYYKSLQELWFSVYFLIRNRFLILFWLKGDSENVKPVQQKMKTFNFLVSGFLALEERCPLENAITLSCYPSSFILDIDYSVLNSLVESYSSCQNLEYYSNNRVIQVDLGIQMTFSLNDLDSNLWRRDQLMFLLGRFWSWNSQHGTGLRRTLCENGRRGNGW